MVNSQPLQRDDVGIVPYMAGIYFLLPHKKQAYLTNTHGSSRREEPCWTAYMY